MKKISLFFLSIFILFNLIGCSAVFEQKETQENKQTDHAENNEEDTGTLKTVVDTTPYGTCEIKYPDATGTNAISEKACLLIRQELDSQIRETCGEDLSDMFIKLDHSVTLQNDEVLCVLFEGYVAKKHAAHPTNLTISVCILLNTYEAIDPLTLFELDDMFLSAFRDALKKQDSGSWFDPDQWEEIVSYINGYSDEEIANMIRSNPKQTITFQADGVIVLFPISHALGDYIKIYVPCMWDTGQGDGSVVSS